MSLDTHRHLGLLGQTTNVVDAYIPIGFCLACVIAVIGWIYYKQKKRYKTPSLLIRKMAPAFMMVSVNGYFLFLHRTQFNLHDILWIPLITCVGGPVILFIFLVVWSGCIKLHDSEVLVARDVYDKIGNGMEDCFICFLAQGALLSVYAWGIFESGTLDFTDLRVIAYYLVGLLVQVAYVLNDGIESFTNLNFWTQALVAARLNASYRGPDNKTLTLQLKADLCMRLLFSLTVNTGGFCLLTIFLPLQLAASSDPINFVLNAIAVFFIIELDDRDETVYKLVRENVVRVPASFDSRRRCCILDTAYDDHPADYLLMQLDSNNTMKGIDKYHGDVARSIEVPLSSALLRRDVYDLSDNVDDASHVLRIQLDSIGSAVTKFEVVARMGEPADEPEEETGLARATVSLPLSLNAQKCFVLATEQSSSTHSLMIKQFDDSFQFDIVDDKPVTVRLPVWKRMDLFKGSRMRYDLCAHTEDSCYMLELLLCRHTKSIQNMEIKYRHEIDTKTL